MSSKTKPYFLLDFCIKRILIVFIILSSLYPLAAQQSDYIFDFVLLPDGNSTGYVNSIIVDEQGLLWMSGDNGLLLFNGKDFQIFNKESEANFLDIDVIVNLFEYDKDYYLLLGDDEIHWFNKNTRVIEQTSSFPIHILPGRVPTAQIANLAITKDKTIWLLSPITNDSMYLATIDKEGNPKYIDKVHSMDFPRIVSNNDQVVVGRVGGINVYSCNNDEVQSYEVPSPPGHQFIPYSMQFVDDGSLWIKGDCEFEYFLGKNAPLMDCNIYIVHPEDQQFKIYDELKNEDLNKTFFMHKAKDHIWIGGDNLLLKKFDTNTKNLFSYSGELLSSFQSLSRSPFFTQILAYYEDKGGTLWISSTAGLIKGTVNPDGKFNQYLRSDSRFCKSICVMHGITEDNDANIYIAYNNEVSKIDPSTGKTSFVASKPSSTDIATSYSIIYRDNKLYWNDFIYDLDSKEFSYAFDAIATDEICSFIDKDDNWWIETSTESGLGVTIQNLNNLQTKTLEVSKEFSNANHINQIIQSKKDGHLWIATLDGGIFEFTEAGQQLHQYNDSDTSALKLDDDYIASIMEDADHNMWVGSKKGLSKINKDRNKIDSYTDYIKLYRSTIRPREIYAILEAGSEHLLLSTNKGILRFHKATGSFETLKGLSVLHDEEFNRLSSYISSDSTFYFGSVNGLFGFKLDDIEPYFSNSSQYELAISSIQIFNNTDKEIRSVNINDLSKPIALKHTDGYLEADYILPDNQMAEKIIYSHRLLGLTDTWSQATNNTNVRYNHLPPGEYTLEIRAGYELHKPDYAVKSFDIVVHQAWYNLWWVQILAILLVGLLVYGFARYRYRLEAARRQEFENLRIKISSDLHDDVGSTLSGLSMQAQVLAYSAKGEQKKLLDQISELSNTAMETMRDTVWAIDARQDKYKSLINRMNDFAQANLVNTNISYNISAEGIDEKSSLQPNVRQQLYLIFKEALSNTIRHSSGTQVKIKIIKTDNILSLYIRDNGTNKSTSSNSGQGIQNMEMRAKRIGGQLKTWRDNGYHVLVELMT